MALTQLSHVADNELMAECIDNCSEASQAAEWCASECIELGDSELAECIQHCRDVADIAALHARMMARGSPGHEELAEPCARMCTACAEICETFEHGHCQTCARVLRTCADSCRQMANQ